MIIIPGARWATRPVCGSRSLGPVRSGTTSAHAAALPAPVAAPAPAAFETRASVAALALAAPPRWTTRPVCASRRLDGAALPGAIKWGTADLLAA